MKFFVTAVDGSTLFGTGPDTADNTLLATNAGAAFAHQRRHCRRGGEFLRRPRTTA